MAVKEKKKARPTGAVDGQLRPLPEMLYAGELKTLASDDPDPRPPGWNMSPRRVKAFICGDEAYGIRRKYYGDDTLIERAIIALAGNRGLMLVGEPGTAKTMLSELLTAAICGDSTNTIQGTAGTLEDQIKYSWNYALLLAEGPTTRALVSAPLYVGMKKGVIVRFEEITRCPPEIQDVLISVLSDKMMLVPELTDGDRVLMARPGFNVIATANTRDRGVHEMSSALKRRFNFETVPAIKNLRLEVDLVIQESRRLLEDAGAPVVVRPEVVELLVTTFQDMREGKTAEGIKVEQPSPVMSTAEAVSVAMAAGLDAHYFGAGEMQAEHVVRHLGAAVQKEDPEDLTKLKRYFDMVVRKRSQAKGGLWEDFLKARNRLP